MAKRIDTSGLDAEFVINQAKPSNREKELKPYSPSLSNQEPVEVDAEIDITKENEIVSDEPETTVKEKDATQDNGKRRRSKSQPEQDDYETLFIRNASANTRNGKAVYIRKEFHDRIMRIVQNIGYNELSLFSYIDNVLEHHFSVYRDEISELYRKRKPEDIF